MSRNKFYDFNFKIDYKKIADAINFYQEKGFKYIEVPWCVSKEADNITCPKVKKNLKSFLGHHVGSAEQSFLQLVLDGKLKEGKYVSCSPCFRDDKVDLIHHKWFMKVELINFIGNKKLSRQDKNKYVKEIVDEAVAFFSRYLEVKLVKTKKGVDIFSKEGIELGSYGVNRYKNFYWVYGTGVAEPRLSYVLNKISKGYHLEDIPRGVIGDASKIFEEVEEFRDALKQKNKVMGLVELSDLIGAVEGYLEKEFEGSISFEDLIKIKDATRRAFENGRR